MCVYVCDDNIQMDFEEREWETVYLSHLAHDKENG
jgi:hypothetical protein